MNGAIRAPKVRCIDPEGNQLGVITLNDAITAASDFGLDLVEVQPNAEPPVCRFLIMANLNTRRRSAQMKRAKAKVIEVKEIKLRPNIDEHDYQEDAQRSKVSEWRR